MKKYLSISLFLIIGIALNSTAFGSASDVLSENEIERGMTQIEVLSSFGEPDHKNKSGEVLKTHTTLIAGLDDTVYSSSTTVKSNIEEWFYIKKDGMGIQYLYSFLFISNTLKGVSAKEKGKKNWVLLTQY